MSVRVFDRDVQVMTPEGELETARLNAGNTAPRIAARAAAGRAAISNGQVPAETEA